MLVITPCNLSGICQHTQIGRKLSMFAKAETLGKDISNLVFTRNKMDLYIFPMNTFSNKLQINFYVFGACMVEWIYNYVCG